MSGDDVDAELAGLPEEVRARVVSLTADALPQVPTVPPALRKVADFAPARRARLGATAISAALADEEFRERVAIQVEAGRGSPRGNREVPAPDPVEQGALAWLARPEGWERILGEVRATLAAKAEVRSGDGDDGARWRDKAHAADRALREARTRHRAELADLKAENVDLRRKLGEARSRLREATVTAEASSSAADEARQEVEARSAALEREVRQLRAKIERFEAEALAVRRTTRADKDEATIRARLLLDTVIDAANGLRRELSLPSVAGAPGDRVEAELATEGPRTPTSAGALGVASPALLEQYLTMPRARLVVDGYNVSKTAWPSSSLEAQRIRLLNGLAAVVARTGAETTVVFDAAATAHRPVVASPRGVKVRFSPEGVIADDVIRDLVGAEPDGRVVIVVTSDQELARDVERAGARSATAESLVGLLDRSG